MQHRYPSFSRRVCRPLAALGLLLATAGAAHAQALTATFAPVVLYRSGGAVPISVAVADVNGDGKPDVLTTNSTGTVGVLLGNGNGTFQPATSYSAGTNPSSIVVADVNGDSYPDLLTANSNSTASVLLGNGNGTFQPATTLSTGTNSLSTAIVVADVNGDGKPDVLAANAGSNVAGVLLGNGNGTFQPITTFGTGGNASSIVAADVNGDGWLDAITTTNGGAGVLLGNGNGTFQAVATYSAGSNFSRVAVADVNGDGYPDLLTANFNSNSNTAGVLLGNGNGTFQPVATYSTGTNSLPTSIAVADVNGDGKLDLLTSNTNSNTAGVLLGNGNGTFQPVATYSTGTNSSPNGIAVADVNGDGKPDVLTSQPYNDAVGLLLNTTRYGAPMLTSLSPAAGPVGTSVTLTGINLTGTTAISFNGTVATTFSVVNATTLTATVPSGASTGPVTVTTPIGTNSGVAFTVTNAPTVTTSATAVTSTSATLASAMLGGNVTNSGNAAVTERGVVYSSTTTTPTIGGTGVTQDANGAGTGSYSKLFTSLAPGTTYYVRAYATNSVGTSYGPAVSFTTFTSTSVVAISRADSNPTSASGVRYTVTFAAPVTGLSTYNFSLTPSGNISGATIAGVIGSGTTYTVTVLTGSGNGTLRLDLVNIIGLSPGLTNLPFAGEVYTITNPTVSSLSPATGPVGTPVTITGTNLGGTTAVSFNGTPASSFVVNSATSITAVVAAGTTTGLVRVTTPSGTANSIINFVVRVAPTTVADAYTTPAGVTLTGNVLTNDIGTNPRAILIIRPTNGVLALNPDGSFSYRPNVGFVGTDSFIYYACDPAEPLLCGNPVTVSITVTPGRVPPVTVADSYATPAGVTLTGNVLTNDIGTNPRAILIILPTRGTLVLNPNGTFTYRPNAGFVGSDSFIYYACDPGQPLLCGNPVTVSITVLPAGSSARGAAPATGAPAAKPAASAAASATGALELTLAGHPNPFADELQLSFSLPSAQAYTLALYDAQGHLVRQLSSGQAEARQAQQLTVPTQGYAAGLYLVRLSTSTGTQLLKLLKQ